MGKLFGGSTAAPPAPPVVRMPVQTDPSILTAGARSRAEAMKRMGRLSTILSDSTASLTGSSGQLGA